MLTYSKSEQNRRYCIIDTVSEKFVHTSLCVCTIFLLAKCRYKDLLIFIVTVFIINFFFI